MQKLLLVLLIIILQLAYSLITVRSPTSDDSFRSGEIVNITWSANETKENPLFKVELLKDDKLELIIFSSKRYTDDGYFWRVSDDVKSHDNYKIRVSEIENEDNWGVSGTFNITQIPQDLPQWAVIVPAVYGSVLICCCCCICLLICLLFCSGIIVSLIGDG